MGCYFPGARRCSSSPYAVDNSNPNPNNFLILKESEKNGFLVLLVLYPNAKNYEGQKLLVYQGIKSSKEVLRRTGGKLDPHFASKGVSPVARFAPTKESLELIERMVGK